MPIDRYSIRNVYSLADPELYKASDRDDPEALLEGVAMAGLVGLLRQLGDLAEFAAEIFHQLHEEAMATAARGHGLLVRVQQLESEIPSIEKAYLSQTSHSAFFPNSGIDWHPTRHTTQNLITTGDLPRFVMGSYEECRGPPRLFLLDKFDVAGAGACLKRYTDPSVFKVEASCYEIETADTQRDKRSRKNKKGSNWNAGETPDVSQPSHVKLHQLFLEERVQTGALEPARRVKLKKRLNSSPFDSGSGESYMNKVISSSLDLESGESYVKKLFRSSLEDQDVPEGVLRPLPLTLTFDTSMESRLEIPDDNIMGSMLGSPMQSKSPCVSSSLEKTAYEGSTDHRLKTGIHEEVDEKQIAVDEEIKTDGFQNGHASDDIASETESYMDAIATMDSERDLNINDGTYSDANKDQLQSQWSASQSIESLTASDEGNSSITKNITMSADSDTASISTGNTSPVGADLSPRPFACIEIPFRPRVPPIAENILMIEHLENDVTSDTCIDVRKPAISSEAASAPHVDQLAMLEEGTSNKTDLNEVSLNDIEILDSPKRSEVHQGDLEVAAVHSDFLPTAVDDLSSFSFVKNLKGDVDDKYPNDTSIPMISLPNIFDSNEVQYAEGYRGKDSVDSLCSSPHSDTSHVDTVEEQPSDIHDSKVDHSDSTFCDDVPVAEETPDRSGIHLLPEHRLKEVGDGESRMYDSVEAAVAYSSENERESNNLELEVGTCAVSDLAAKEEAELQEREIESGNTVPDPDNVDRNDGKDLGDDTELEGRDVDIVHLDMRASVPFSSPIDVDKHKDSGCSSLEDCSVINHLCILQDSKESGEHVEVDQLWVISTDLESDVDSTSLNSKISQDHRNQEAVLHDLVSQPVDVACDLSNVLMLDGTPDSTVSTEVVHNVDSKSYEEKIDQPNDQIDRFGLARSSPDLTVSTEVVLNIDSLPLENKIDQPKIDILEAAESSPGENEVDQSSGQVSARVVFLSFDNKIDQPNDQIDMLEAAQSPPGEDKVDRSSGQLSARVDSLFLENMIDQPNDQIDIFEAAKSSSGEDKVDQSSGQLSARDSQVLSQLEFLTHVDHEILYDTRSKPYQVNLTCQSVAQEEDQGKPVQIQGLQSSPESYPAPVSENPPTTELLQGDTPYVDLSDQVKHQSAPVLSGLAILPQLDSVKQENMPPLPPLPPMQWRMRLPPTDGGQRRDDHFPPTFSFTPSEHPQVVDRSTLDEMINLNTVNQKSQHSMGGVNQMLSPESSLHTEDEKLSVSSEAKVTQTEVKTAHASCILNISDQEVFEPQSKPYSLPPVVNISDNSPPVFASMCNEDPHMVGHSREDETKYLNTENSKPVSQMSLSDSRIHTKDHDKQFVLSEEKFAENLVPEAAAQTTSVQENLRPSTNAYSFPLDVDEMANNIQPMKIQQPRSPLIDAVAAHDKTKLRKVLDRTTTQSPIEEEHDTILDQIRAKAFKLKPAIQTRPASIQGPMTNLRVAAILEKANAIRQAFAGSDDDSDSWSD
uniref:protein SCAR2 n=1 Tax=Erigeron canadensis TaxID=72917 RepID=UPI001CB8A436|nr:protein SCAR2 [Erigeron canadensis]